MKFSSALIIDNEVDICMLLSNYLSKKIIVVNYETSLKGGKMSFIKNKPELVIIDHNLEDGFGIDSINEFKKSESHPIVIVMSAMGNIKSHAIKEGADYFVQKPISYSDLNNLIESW